MYGIVIAALILIIAVKILNVNTIPETSLFYSANVNFLEQILKHAPRLAEPYTPTRLWGYSGHIQTICQGVISFFHCPLLNGKRFAFKATDGGTVTYELYQPLDKHPNGDEITLALAPGICNSSESVYIRRVVYHAQFSGYRVAVLNHVGALKCVPVTSPRIFNYGNTTDYEGMVHNVIRRYPTTKIICIGFSMGGNIVTKYLGEKKAIRQIIAGISACQGYDAHTSLQLMFQWENFRRLYFFAMTENMRAILRRWQKQLFPEEIKRSKGINERAIWAANTLVDIDEAYTRKLYGYKTVQEMYSKWSSCNYWHNITVPMVFINTKDDPIVPPAVVDKVKAFVSTQNNTKSKKGGFENMTTDLLLIEQKYGGHLGFYEGGFIYPNALTWLDRTVIDLSNSLSMYVQSDGKRPDLKVADEGTKPLNDFLSPGGGDSKEVNTNFRGMSNLLLATNNQFIAKKEGKVLSADGDILSSASSIDSDNTDLEEDAIFMQSPTLKARPVFNCKKRLTSHSKW